MKKHLFIVLFYLPLASCEPAGSDGPLPAHGPGETYNLKSRPGLPGNPDNAFDYAGLVHNEVLYAYYADTILPATADGVIGRVDSIAGLHPYFRGLPAAAYHLVPRGGIEHLSSNGAAGLAAVLEGSPLSPQARNGFRILAGEVLSKVDRGEDYAAIHGLITAYESQTLASPDHTASEKELLLAATSIMRHSAHAKGRRPKKNTDPDWDWLTANIAGAVLGAQYGKEHAVLAALKAGIMENTDTGR